MDKNFFKMTTILCSLALMPHALWADETPTHTTKGGTTIEKTTTDNGDGTTNNKVTVTGKNGKSVTAETWSENGENLYISGPNGGSVHVRSRDETLDNKTSVKIEPTEDKSVNISKSHDDSYNELMVVNGDKSITMSKTKNEDGSTTINGPKGNTKTLPDSNNVKPNVRKIKNSGKSSK